MICNCLDWRENIDKVNGPIVLQAARQFGTGEGGYDGKKFEYCPWCAKELQEEQ